MPGSPPAGQPVGEPPEPGQSGVLRIERLEVTYGRTVRALRGVGLTVAGGSVVALLGANGAGKSTLLRAVSGTLRLHGGAVTGGTVRYDGRVLDGADPVTAVRSGVVQVPEGRRVFGGMSVEENLRAGRLGLAGGLRRGRGSDAAGARAARERVYGLFPRLAERSGQRAGLLSGGEQQMLAIGRALMAAPRLLLLDEPSLGLAPMMVERIAEVVRDIHAQGTSVLLVEQNAAMALALADYAYVLEVGEVRLEGPAGELARTDEVSRLYLGEAGEADTAAGADAERSAG
ncbi:ABC transporter ATP-binding protein [Streptomyces sp. N2-109]|uniref:ABC transporter ATP-binding protein n=1 Tax=Streptomyces gossypii TaxID=2883101 RepID=A0ABT2K4A9_9ACTN|nr:ABC transporter ATP-binding protein [Streptomyces gossypii]MCT2594340.1 ABC transporter ATP-binding protein [Streptomyces gossypii]